MSENEFAVCMRIGIANREMDLVGVVIQNGTLRVRFVFFNGHFSSSTRRNETSSPVIVVVWREICILVLQCARCVLRKG